MLIKIAKDYSEVPAGRYPSDGPFNGERFREEILRKALSRAEPVTVDLDGTRGYGSSFLEEAFGGLVRKRYYSADELHKRLNVVAQNVAFRRYVDSIWHHIDEAGKKQAGQS